MTLCVAEECATTFTDDTMDVWGADVGEVGTRAARDAVVRSTEGTSVGVGLS